VVLLWSRAFPLSAPPENDEHGGSNTRLPLVGVVRIDETEATLYETEFGLVVDVLVEGYGVGDGVDEHDDCLAFLPFFMGLSNPQPHL